MLGLVTGGIWLAAIAAMLHGYDCHVVAAVAIFALLGCCWRATA